MSKKSTADNEPSNALTMRTLNNLSAKFDRLPKDLKMTCTVRWRQAPQH